MSPDLSSFYQHALAYGDYVALAYGLSAVILGVLVCAVLLKQRRLKKSLSDFEAS